MFLKILFGIRYVFDAKIWNLYFRYSRSIDSTDPIQHHEPKPAKIPSGAGQLTVPVYSLFSGQN